MKFTEKQRRFVDYFVETGNKAEAARRAGYKQPFVQGSQNYEKLRKVIDERLSEKDSSRIANQNEVLAYLTSVLRDESLGHAVRICAANLLAKRYGMYTPKFDLGGKVTIIFSGENDLE